MPKYIYNTNICIYYCSNYCNNSVVVSLISSRSPSVRTIRSMCVFLFDLCFLHYPIVCSCPCLFNVKGVLFSSPPPPSYPEISCSSVCCEAYPSTYSMFRCSFSTCSFALHSFSVCSCSTATLAATSFFLFSVNAHVAFWASSLCFCTMVNHAAELSTPFLVPTQCFVGSRHSTG